MPKQLALPVASLWSYKTPDDLHVARWLQK